MSRLKYAQKNGVVTWSPTTSSPHYVCSGTLAGGLSMDFSRGGTLDMFKVDLASPAGELAITKSVATSSKFCSLVWGLAGVDAGVYREGLLAGGMDDGSIMVWDASCFVNGSDAESQVASIVKHQGAVKALDWNPAMKHLLASGGMDGNILIHDLTNPADAKTFPMDAKSNTTSEISCVRWNKQVEHVLASGYKSGSTSVWDLKSSQQVCQFSPGPIPCTSVAWHPDEALKLMASYDDDQHHVVHYWDLRNAQSPVASFYGHTKGVLSLSWCPHDSGLLLSSGKDNRTLCWDPQSCAVMMELPMSERWTSDVQWSPRVPGLLSTSSSDGLISIYTLSEGGTAATGAAPAANPAATNALANTFGDAWQQPAVAAMAETANGAAADAVKPKEPQLKYPPKWVRRQVGACWGFGGRLITFKPAPDAAGAAPLVGAKPTSSVAIHRVATEPSFVSSCQALSAATSAGQLSSYCAAQVASSVEEKDKDIWQIMQILSEEDPRRHLLYFLGFTQEEMGLPALAAAANAAVAAPPSADGQVPPPPLQALGASPNIPAHISPAPTAHYGDGAGAADAPPPASAAPETAFGIQRALISGNVESAVDKCLASGRMADALLLAAYGGVSLFDKTRTSYLASHKEPFMAVMSAILSGQFEGLVQSATLEAGRWKETLALLCTYALSNEFSPLCDALGDRLKGEAGDVHGATLCYLCAGAVDKVVELWAADAAAAGPAGPAAPYASLGKLVEKVQIFRQSTRSQGALSGTLSTLLTRYAEAMVGQGLAAESFGYLNMVSGGDAKVLSDRVHHSLPPALQGTAPPEFPFEKVDVSVVQQPQQVFQQQQQGPAATAQAAHNPFAAQAAGVGGAAGVGAPALHPWVENYDPASKRTYYFNQQTQQSQWEMPAELAATIAPAPITTPGVPGMGGSPSNPIGSNPATPQIGGGLATSTTSNPGMFQPQPNTFNPSVATPNPAGGGAVAAGGVAGSAGGVAKPAAATVAVPPEFEYIVSGMKAAIAAATAAATDAANAKKLADCSKKIEKLYVRLSEKAVPQERVLLLNQFVQAMSSQPRDYAAANNVCTKVNKTSDWGADSEWMPALKALVRLASTLKC